MAIVIAVVAIKREEFVPRERLCCVVAINTVGLECPSPISVALAEYHSSSDNICCGVGAIVVPPPEFLHWVGAICRHAISAQSVGHNSCDIAINILIHVREALLEITVDSARN